MSDGATSDGSHMLYREVDPYNRESFIGPDNLTSPTSTETPKDGNWVAVTRISGAKNQQTATSAVFVPTGAVGQGPRVEEDVDGPELARLARRLWPRSSSSMTRPKAVITSTKDIQNKSSSIFVPRSSSSSFLHSAANQQSPGPVSAGDRHTIAMRPTVLNLRNSTRNSARINGVQDKLSSTFDQLDSPAELDWDLEPGTVSPFITDGQQGKSAELSSVRPPSRTLNAANGSLSSHSDKEYTSKANLFPIRPRRHATTASVHRTNDVPVVPTFNEDRSKKFDAPDDKQTDYTSKFVEESARWTYSDSLAPRLKHNVDDLTAVTAIPCSNLLSPPAFNEDDLCQTSSFSASKVPSDELVDSGFVGLSNSRFEDSADTPGGFQLSDFLWEHEMFGPVQAQQKPEQQPRITFLPQS
ncbi:unnamed protein product [Calicophoron daubneyi]|uniref:Uncharacterized protein n=1 Tax=Calicophoron daubneyi TaxID=300641 RepID=A0AAV2TY06_CALDB